MHLYLKLGVCLSYQYSNRLFNFKFIIVHPEGEFAGIYFASLALQSFNKQVPVHVREIQFIAFQRYPMCSE